MAGGDRSTDRREAQGASVARRALSARESAELAERRSKQTAEPQGASVVKDHTLRFEYAPLPPPEGVAQETADVFAKAKVAEGIGRMLRTRGHIRFHVMEIEGRRVIVGEFDFS